MPEPLTNALRELDAALATSRQFQREFLLRAARRQRIRTRIAFGLSTTIAVFALCAYLIGDAASAKFCAALACVSFIFNFVAQAARRKKALEALSEPDRSA